MKKYKLIKEYPGSPKSGYILEQLKNNKNQDDNYYYNGYWLDPSKYPEFWEEVIEKDYEIMSFRSKESQRIAIKNDKIGSYSYHPSGYLLNEKDLLEDDRSEIYSIKRLSDGEIFYIGDKVRISKLQYDGSFIIDRFYFDCNNDKLLCNGRSSGNGHVSITKIEKVKQPLFTTEDGKEIFKGDKFWFVDKYNFSEGIACDSDIRPYLKHFSTKEAVEKYILMNKPCLSINDVIKEFNMTLSIQKECIGIQKLKELVKEK